ncbi:MAG TPA: SH3 domain-containing protein [Polyangiaceae bacterium]|nr:SH3 domain-containing protein [Polyangiaceae bacterium]
MRPGRRPPAPAPGGRSLAPAPEGGPRAPAPVRGGRLSAPIGGARRPALALALVALAPLGPAACSSCEGRGERPAAPGADLGVTPAQLRADYWVARQPAPDERLLGPREVAAHNARLFEGDPSVRRLEAMPRELGRDAVEGWVKKRSALPEGPLYDERGDEVPRERLAALVEALALGAIPERQATRYGLVARRADLRTFPTAMRVFRAPGDTDIDRFQESALFPGTPVVIAHESAGGAFWFVLSPLYAAWVDRAAVAEGPRAEVLGYAGRAPYLVVTGAEARTVFAPGAPEISSLSIDMGVRLPLARDWPPDRPVHGQHPHAGRVVELPARGPEGRLAFAPALVPGSADVAGDYLPFTRASLLRQAFKFLGERYGWGHSYGARDCSGFVSEVYRSLGVALPRNTSDQAASPALERVDFGEGGGPAGRLAALRALDVGDLVFVPGHVMMVIGHEDGTPYVIHDVHGVSLPGEGGEPRRVPLNGVSVTPLVTLLAGDGSPLVGRVTAVRRVRRAAGRGGAP